MSHLTGLRTYMRSDKHQDHVRQVGGGMWQAGPNLLTLLQAIPVEDDVVLLDLYDNPIKVNPYELQCLTLERWQEQMNAWLLEHTELSKQR